MKVFNNTIGDTGAERARYAYTNKLASNAHIPPPPINPRAERRRAAKQKTYTFDKSGTCYIALRSHP